MEGLRDGLWTRSSAGFETVLADLLNQPATVLADLLNQPTTSASA